MWLRAHKKKTPKLSTNQETVASPRFLVVKKNEGDFAKVNPFLIQKVLYGLVGNVKQVRKIRDGLLVETVTAAQSKRLLQVKKFGDFPVVVVPHNNLNTSRGVIYCRDLLNCSVEDILDGLKDQNVVEVRRIKVKSDGFLVDSPNHILIFNTPVLPKRINVAFYSLQVRLYIPAPLRCFRCQKFGHSSARCNEEQVCVCGKHLHEGQPCTEPVICVNCDGRHSARSRLCPVYKQEVCIQEVKTKENISYNEAKRKVNNVTTPIPNVSYANAASTLVKPDYSELVAQLVPKIISALSASPFLKPTASTSRNLMSDCSEKRKRQESGERASLSSGDETSLSSLVAEVRKETRKRGRPRKTNSDTHL